MVQVAANTAIDYDEGFVVGQRQAFWTEVRPKSLAIKRSRC
jgi:hypothetical protein